MSNLMLTFLTFAKMSRNIYSYRKNVRAGKTLCKGCILPYAGKLFKVKNEKR